MKITLFLMVCIMYFLTKRYNEYDFYENRWLDLLVQVLHIFTLIYMFIVIVSIQEPYLALFCAYVLHKNLNWFTGDLVYEDDDDNDNDDENENNKDTNENNAKPENNKE